MEIEGPARRCQKASGTSLYWSDFVNAGAVEDPPTKALDLSICVARVVNNFLCRPGWVGVSV